MFQVKQLRMLMYFFFMLPRLWPSVTLTLLTLSLWSHWACQNEEVFSAEWVAGRNLWIKVRRTNCLGWFPDHFEDVFRNKWAKRKSVLAILKTPGKVLLISSNIPCISEAWTILHCNWLFIFFLLLLLLQHMRHYYGVSLFGET